MSNDDSHPEKSTDSTMSTVDTPLTTEETPAETVIRAVATATNTPPEDLPVLHHVLDPDALNELVASSDDLVVEFDYAGVHVRVDDEIHVLRGQSDRGQEID